MTHDELQLVMAKWLRDNASLNLEAESLGRILSAIRAEFVSDTGVFCSDTKIANLLQELRQWPHEMPVERRWRWHPRLSLLQHHLGVIKVDRWIRTRPGCFLGKTDDEALQVALNSSGLDVSLHQMRHGLRLYGVDPEARFESDGSKYYVITLPGPRK